MEIKNSRSFGGLLWGGKLGVFPAVLGMLFLVGLPVDAFAALQDFAAASTKWSNQINGFKSFALILAALLGVVLFVLGLWLLYKESKQPGQGNGKNGFVAMFVGASLLSISALIGITSQSLWEDSVGAAASISKAPPAK